MVEAGDSFLRFPVRIKWSGIQVRLQIEILLATAWVPNVMNPNRSGMSSLL